MKALEKIPALSLPSEDLCLHTMASATSALTATTTTTTALVTAAVTTAESTAPTLATTESSNQPSNILILCHMVTAEDVSDPELSSEIEEECSKYGKVVRVCFVTRSSNDVDTFVVFGSEEGTLYILTFFLFERTVLKLK
jgi:hypothetical protein